MAGRTLMLVVPLFVALSTGAASADDGSALSVRIASRVSGHIHPAVCVTQAGTVLVVYSRADFKDLRLTRSADGGRTWADSVAFPGAEQSEIYPGALTTLKDGRVVHAWNVWYQSEKGMKSRYVRFAVSGDDGKTWSEPKDLPKNPAAQSVVRHPLVELADDAWLMSLTDRTLVYNPKTAEVRQLGDGRKHGLVPIVRTPKGTLVSGAGLRSEDGGQSWEAVSPFPKIGADGWRYDLVALDNGWLVASEVLGPGIGGERWRFVVSRDDGKSWDFDAATVFYDPGRAIGGRACPRTAQLDTGTMGTVYYDTDSKQPGGSGVFFRRAPLTSLVPSKP